MKHKPLKNLPLSPQLTKKMVMMITCVMLTIAAYGQQKTTNATQNPALQKPQELERNISFDQFITSHNNEPLVKFYLADPTNKQAGTAVKCLYILSTSQRDNFVLSDIQAMEHIVAEAEKNAKKADELSVKEMKYDQAVKSLNNSEGSPSLQTSDGK
jgi:hypothetical protein